MRIFLAISVFCFCFLFPGCAVKKYENIPYVASKTTGKQQPTLNIYTPRNSKLVNNPVLIFVHGGNWNSGNKKTYWFFGRNFAKKGVTTVIVDYTLSPKANYDDMAKEVATAVEWTKSNISEYKGDPKSIFLTGHSAGGHLVALVATNPKYIQDKSIIKGIIFNDAAGLDMNHYLEENPPSEKNDYLTTWTANPENWKDASPIYFIDNDTPPLMIYMGSKTYESIKVSNTRFLGQLKSFQPNVKPIILEKKHIPMITQYLFPYSKRFKEIKAFIETHK
ncbi:alpha/beta hydrolase [Flavobacterium sp. GT3R68]|uniref:alpha/beta hydrolase n=1 Tax=Flavobacterium sp. GT3R68 TaxID=2594437 RepID=UPI000F89030F|nr:alpha/beta hydrolase [Flavobacterium sp. GT3R68]RTY95372.1 alpha/beta hydrolase [Flavobacterium sp. GSN2]TRW90888.1 alpha/beta hydrolase [Flavobacterium sp. GT3R68]